MIRLFDPTRKAFFNRNALALAIVSQRAYEPEIELKKLAFNWRATLHFWDRNDTQALILEREDFMILAFRGTEADAGDIKADADFIKTPGPLGGNVHRGFLGAFNEVWNLADGPFKLIDELQRSGVDKRLFITGHSLGAALAILAAASLAEHLYYPDGVYVFGAPRVGDWRFVKALDARLYCQIWRLENNNDIVPRVPPWFFGFRHPGQRVYITSAGQIIQQPTWWQLLKDRLRGRWLALGESGTDGIADHSSAEYVRRLR
jgi:triacylglycerol lipase